jgi:tetratricopeptide (TPR) repeat protein
MIKVGTDYIVAVNLSMGQAAVETLFNSTGRVLIIDDEVWLPVAMSSFNDGFMACWTRAVVSLNQAFEREESVDFITVKDGWAAYPPAQIPDVGGRIARSSSDVIITEANRVVDQYGSQDIMPLVWKLEAQVATDPTAASYNRLGILLARAGRIGEARLNYERAANMGLVAAMTNRGSLALAERDYDTAERWFRRALERDSGNSAARQGLERVEGRR